MLDVEEVGTTWGCSEALGRDVEASIKRSGTCRSA